MLPKKQKRAVKAPFFPKISSKKSFNFRGFSNALAQVVKLGSADAAAAHYLNLRDVRAVQRENPFNANAIGHPANGKSFLDTAVFSGDNCSLKVLDSFSFALFNADMNPYGVPDGKLGNFGFGLIAFLFNQF